MAGVEVIAGTHSSARTGNLDRMIFAHWGHVLLLTPTQQLSRRRMEDLLLAADVPGAWGTFVMPLQSFAETILKETDPDAVRLDDIERRLLLKHALACGPGLENQTDGFLNHLLRIIENLKQAAVEPEEFAERIGRRKHPASLDSVVASAYRAYQDALITTHAYDRIGTYWQARRVLEEGHPINLLEGIELVAFDGFDDFTESEFRLIAALRKRVPHLVFSMSADTADSARDLYRLQQRTVNRLEREFGATTECFESQPPASFVEYAAQYLLKRGEAPSPSALNRNLEIVPCAGVTEEAETIGRTIKTLILDGVPAAEIAVVYRDIAQVWPALRSMAREFQIPLRLYGEEPLAASSACAFILDALESTANWRHGEIVELLISPWMDSDGAGDSLTAAIPVLTRLAGIVAGHEQWIQRLERLRDELERDPSHSEREIGEYRRRNPRSVDAVAVALARVRRLDVTSNLLATGSIQDFSGAVADFIEAMQLERVLTCCVSEITRRRETAALASLQELLGRLHARRFSDDAGLSRQDYLRFLRQACSTHGFRTEPMAAERQGVRCLGMDTLRGLRFRYVFFGGLNEGITPRAPGVNAVYAEDDVRELRETGILLEPCEVRGEREFAWFHHVLEVPRDSLWMLWRTATPDGKPLLRSPFLNDLLRLFPDLHIERPPLRAGQYYPALAEAASMRDALNNLCATGAALPSYLAKSAVHVLRGGDIEKKRYSSAPFDAFDGILKREDHRKCITAKYNENHVFSPTELEEYRTCPFKFFALRLLSLMEVETPDTAFDRRELGIVVHGVLEEFHRRYHGIPVADIPPEEAYAVMRELTDAAFDDRKRNHATVPEGVLAAERLSVHDRLAAYLTIEHEEKVPWRPVQFEAVFDKAGSSYPPLRVETEHGTILMHGRIDRIDEGGEGHRVIDYKIGSVPSAGDLKEGVALQLVAYALALEQAIAPGAKCAEAVLMQVGTRQRRRICDEGRSTKWEESKQGFFLGVTAALLGIREACFPPTPRPDVCSYCEARRMCRIDPSRIDRKKENA